MLPTLHDLQTFAYQAGEILRNGLDLEHKIRLKGKFDLVTEVDHQSEELLIGSIRERFGGHYILAEESGSLPGNLDHCWYIDPLDGTTNYAHGLLQFCVSIAYAYQGQVVLGVIYDPTREECYSAERHQGAWLNGQPLHVSAIDHLQHALLATSFPSEPSENKPDNMQYFLQFDRLCQSVRRLGSSALEQCYVAAGRLDGYWSVETSPWDIAAGGLIITESGGMIGKLDGTPDILTPPHSLLCANPSIYAQMLAIICGT